MQMEAIRNAQTETPKQVPQSVRWLTHVERKVCDLDLNYSVKKHGSYSKKIVDEFIVSTDCKDLLVESMTLLVNSDEARKAAAELLMKGGVPPGQIRSGEDYVAYFENTPCRRFPSEEKAPQWIDGVMSFRTEEEKQLGFEPAVMDLVHVLPFDVWRDVEGKKRISRAFEREVERIKNMLNVHDDPAFSKTKIMYSLFPKAAGIVGGRQEALTEKDTWVVVGFD